MNLQILQTLTVCLTVRNLSETSEVYETSYDTMWGPVMKAFPKRYQKSDGLQVQLCRVGARQHEIWDP